MFNSLMLPFVVAFLADHLAAGAAALDPASTTSSFDTWLKTKCPYLATHPGLNQLMDDIANPVITACIKGAQDAPDVKAIIVGLAQKNPAAAVAALLSLAKGAAPAIAPILATL